MAASSWLLLGLVPLLGVAGLWLAMWLAVRHANQRRRHAATARAALTAWLRARGRQAPPQED